MRIITLLCLLVLITFNAWAERYKLEVLLFRQPMIGMDNETWSSHPPEPQLNTRLPQAERRAPQDLFYYKNQLAKKTVVLLQDAWLIDDAGEAILNENNNAFRLRGSIQVRGGHYLSVKTHLILELAKSELPRSIQSQFDDDIAAFPLKDRRKVNPGNVYYYDHPILGMLVKINKIKT